MLRSLSIENIVLIERLTLEFDDHLIALTGETGAGKSILLDSLGLALGLRADSKLIRHGADRAHITANFQIDIEADSGLAMLFDENGITYEGDGQIILRRQITKDGRSRAWINDISIGLSLLKQIGEQLIEIQGQFDQHGLLNNKNHRDILDRAARARSLRLSCAEAHQDWSHAKMRLQEAIAERDKAQADYEYINHCVQELGDLDPQPDEFTHLSQKRQQAKSAARLLEYLSDAQTLVSGDEGATSMIAKAQRKLDQTQDQLLREGEDNNIILPASVGLEQALVQLDVACEAVMSAIDDIEENASNLEDIEERFFMTKELAKKHRCDENQLHEIYVQLAQKLSLCDDNDQSMANLSKDEAQKRQYFYDQCNQLTAVREKAALVLSKKILAELPALKLDKTQLIIQLVPKPQEQWNGNGAEQVTFMVTTNPGQPPAPLSSIASGGELSRFLLAFKIGLQDQGQQIALVFDEVDSGLGGATADAVGQRLKQLAEKQQILAITHSPQVAALAEQHLQVRKQQTDQKTTTEVISLDHDSKIEEIARMLSGAQITREAREAARQLLIPHSN